MLLIHTKFFLNGTVRKAYTICCESSIVATEETLPTTHFCLCCCSCWCLNRGTKCNWNNPASLLFCLTLHTPPMHMYSIYLYTTYIILPHNVYLLFCFWPLSWLIDWLQSHPYWMLLFILLMLKWLVTWESCSLKWFFFLRGWKWQDSLQRFWSIGWRQFN